MLHIEKWKMILIAALSVAGLLYAAPNMVGEGQRAWLQNNLPSWLPTRAVNLGLDLQGGSHLLLQADTSVVIRETLGTMESSARSELRRKDIGYTGMRVEDNSLSFRLRDPAKDRDAAYGIASALDENAVVHIADDGTVRVALEDAALAAINTRVMGQSIEIIRRRVDETGTREPVIQRQGRDRVVVQLPGVDDPERIKALLGKTAKMSFHLVDLSYTGGRPAPGSVQYPMRDEPGRSIVVKRRVQITGDQLVDAQATFQDGQPVVSFRFNSIGAKRFCEVTRENVNKPFAIVLDREVISAPNINEPICGGSGIISGRFTVKEAGDLAVLLRAGALPAPLKIVEERSVGPTLGSDSIAGSKVAALWGFALVALFMAVTYGLFGVFANIALVFNLALIFALLSVMQVTLTLPGIAGIILTIGMAVDANVLIYERIREEQRNGRSLLSSLDMGFRHAKDTIIDANLTTLIVSLILFSFGSGPVKGFAVAVTVGIATTLFSALMITRLIVVWWLKLAKPRELKV